MSLAQHLHLHVHLPRQHRHAPGLDTSERTVAPAPAGTTPGDDTSAPGHAPTSVSAGTVAAPLVAPTVPTPVPAPLAEPPQETCQHDGSEPMCEACAVFYNAM